MASPTEARKAIAKRKALPEDKQEKQEVAALSPKTTLEIDVVDGRGKRWEGKFNYTVPNLGLVVEIGRLKTAMAAGQSLLGAAPESMILVEMLAYCEITIDHDKAPEWWAECDHGAKLYDAVPLRALYEEGRAYEDRFHGSGEDARGDEEDSSEAGDSGGDVDAGGVDVVEDVQAPAKRHEVILDHSP